MQDDAEEVHQMISTRDQEDIFRLIADYLEKNITCVAIGGTAMMFMRYKAATKDIDLVFLTEEDRETFIRAIEALGYREKAIGDVYDERRKGHRGRPVMYSRGDERFDLFVEDVFGYRLGFDQQAMVQRNDFLGRKELTLLQPPLEELILLKAITCREKDYEDIETILEIERTIDWNALVARAVKQRKRNPWILIDLEETLRHLQKRFFIKQEVFDAIYRAQE